MAKYRDYYERSYGYQKLVSLTLLHIIFIFNSPRKVEKKQYTILT